MERSDGTTVTPIGTIGTASALDPDLLLRAVRKSLGVRGWRWHRLSELRESVTDQELIYHPLWLGKVLTLADRPPFPPKRIPNAAFVDAVSGYRGVLERIPEVSHGTNDDGRQVKPVINTEQQAKRYVQAVMHTVNRGYVLKKPQHQLASLELLYMPLWKVTAEVPERRVVHVNAVTVEPETYMARQWQSADWLSLDTDALAPLSPTTR
ncbi:hypothetical protein [Nesterenkonia natronophila]|nr:hypothetical protein [Nesterenkonia natronophila]